MVTEAGKELLRNSINTANFHNKILEQNEMWKQWEMERGLTMMISDDDILKRIRKNHRCQKHRMMAEQRERSRDNGNSEAIAGTSSSDRWDHSGFKELYPDEDSDKKSSSSVIERSQKWGHSGFHELYPDEARRRGRSSSVSSSSNSDSKKLRDSSSSSEEDRRQSSGKKCKKRCHNCRQKALKVYEIERNRRKRYGIEFPDDIEERLLLVSNRKVCKGQHKEKKKRRKSEASTSDNEIFMEFKEFKRKRREKLKHSKHRKHKHP